MRRRQLLGSLAVIPTLAALPSPAQNAAGPKTALEEYPKLATTSLDAVAEPAPRFFTASQMGTLRKLAALIVPRTDARPGALEAGVPEFLDFLLEASPEDRQSLYRNGLDALEAASHNRFGKSFSALPERDAAVLLAPLEAAWTFQGPADHLARFLHAAKDDILRGTINSRQFAAASGGRRGAGVGAYWLPLE